MSVASASIPQLDALLTEVERLNSLPTVVEKAGMASLGLQGGPLPSASKWEGDLYIGVFFDGTGNNKDTDYGPESDPRPFLERAHSNVARLYNAFPDERSSWRQETKSASDKNQFYRIYVPGIGTRFPEIGEKENDSFGVGEGTGLGGEKRLLWAMVQVLNAVHKFCVDPWATFITDSEAFSQINMMSDGDKLTRIMRVFSINGTLYNIKKSLVVDNAARQRTFRDWIDKRLVLPDIKPRLRNIYIYPFGFSRGAAEARVFCNWMTELLKIGSGTSGTLRLKGRKVFFPFLGIFDTVASVGAAALWSIMEGRSAWAEKTLEISHYVQKCVHMVAAHEIRSCFPLDTVRRGGVYRGNCEEIVYPGAHSDVGGGYLFNALGKADLGESQGNLSSGDMQISRVPGFDMYLRATQVGVPFYRIEQLKMQGRESIAKDLLPDTRTIKAMQAYLVCSGIGALPVEEQLRRHTSLYLHWRWRLGSRYSEDGESVRLAARTHRNNREAIKKKNEELKALRLKVRHERMRQNYKLREEPSRPAMIQAEKDLAALTFPHPDAENAGRELGKLARTQKELIQVIAGYCQEIDRRIEQFATSRDWKPLENPHSLWLRMKQATKTAVEAATEVSFKVMAPGYEAASAFVKEREKQLDHPDSQFDPFVIAASALLKLEQWRQALLVAEVAEEHDSDAPEREAMWLLDGLKFGDAYRLEHQEMFGRFFSAHVHDSMAGFPVQEFFANGYGIGKFRRLYFGNDGDLFARKQMEEGNAARRSGKMYYRGSRNKFVPPQRKKKSRSSARFSETVT